MDIFVYMMYTRSDMAKLYWRIKIDGAWTWKAAVCTECEWHLEDGKLPCCDINKEAA